MVKIRIKRNAEKLQEAVLALNDGLEVEIHNGKQPLYPFLISVE